jgi:polyisoprenoid-binding protein YceI
MKAPSRLAMFCMAVVLPVAMWAADAVASREIDTQKSVMTVRVFKSGLLSAFGHEHAISAPIRQGTFKERDYSVELAVDAGKMRVMDKDVSEKDRAEIQETMLGPKVLDAGKFPEIRFRSTAVVESKAGGHWIVSGELSLHGQTQPIRLEVQGENGHYRGRAELKQRAFGIEPVSVGGGTVKVKDELRVEFEIVAKP